MSSIRFAVAGVTATLLLVLGIAPVLASQPAVIERNGTHVVDIPGFVACSTTSLDYHLVVRRTITERYGRDGELTRWELSSVYAATLTDPASERVVRDDGTRRITDDYVRQQTTIVGGAHHVTAPGLGLVFGEVGRVVYDWNGTPDDFDDDVQVFAAGIHQDAEAVVRICSIVD